LKLKKYEIGPFATSSRIYNFCLDNNTPIKRKLYEEYGFYWCAIVGEEEALILTLKFPSTIFKITEYNNEIL